MRSAKSSNEKPEMSPRLKIVLPLPERTAESSLWRDTGIPLYPNFSDQNINQYR